MELPDIVAEAAKVLYFPANQKLAISMFDLFAQIFNYSDYTRTLLILLTDVLFFAVDFSCYNYFLQGILLFPCF